MKELSIIAAAVVKPDGTQVWLPPPARHHDVIRKICSDDGSFDQRSQQGFRVSDGSFANRSIAFEIAKKAGQLKETAAGARLYSEDLW